VYITEAHASDTWPLGSEVSIVASHKNLEDRIQCARKLVGLGMRIPVVVDSMDDAFCGHYASWPERFYIMYGGRLAFVAQPKFAAYRPIELRLWIEAYLAQQPEKESKAKAKAKFEPSAHDRSRGDGVMTLSMFQDAREVLAALEQDYEEQGIETAMCEYDGICSRCGYEGYINWYEDDDENELCYDCAEELGYAAEEE